VWPIRLSMAHSFGTPIHGMRKLQEVLWYTGDLATQLAGWVLETANDISSDGRIIVGTGKNPQGKDEAWIATIELTDAALMGDYNNNSAVDVADYVLWRNGGPLLNDPTSGVQPEDYDFWRARFGAIDRVSSSTVLSVPEPTSSSLMFVVVALLQSLFRSASPRKHRRKAIT
jgi:hypothetical protein